MLLRRSTNFSARSIRSLRPINPVRTARLPHYNSVLIPSHRSLSQSSKKHSPSAALADSFGADIFIDNSLILDASLPDVEKNRVVSPGKSDRPTIAILGSGWGAISFLKHIDSLKYNVVIISPRNYFLFTPLLPSCPVGTVDEKSIVEPVVSFANRKEGDVTYYQAEATSINPDQNTVTIKSYSNASLTRYAKDFIRANEIVDIKYDYLITAVGAEPNTFGIPGVEEHGCFLKEISDSKKIRHQFIEAIEKANLLHKDDPERKRLLTLVVVGGGPTGVETAAELQDYIDQDLKTFFPNIVDEISIKLVEAMPVVLNMFEKRLTSYAERVLKETRIDLRTETTVQKVDKKYITVKSKVKGTIKESVIPYGVLVWATGNKQRPIINDLGRKIPAQRSSNRGLKVNDNLLVQGTNNIFAIGDNSYTKLPPTAQVAHQEAEYLTKVMNKLADMTGFHECLSEKKEKVDLFFQEYGVKPFKYVHLGSLAYLGSEKAIANITYGDRSFYSGGGVMTFWIWKVLYVSMILSLRSKFRVVADWIKIPLFGRDAFKEL